MGVGKSTTDDWEGEHEAYHDTPRGFQTVCFNQSTFSFRFHKSKAQNTLVMVMRALAQASQRITSTMPPANQPVKTCELIELHR